MNKLEGVFAQRHSFMKASIPVNTDLKRRITYSYGHPGSTNPAVITNKDAYMIYADMNNNTRSLEAVGFRKKTR